MHNLALVRQKKHLEQIMAFTRAPLLVQDGSFHRSIDQKINGWSFWSIARKNSHLEMHFAIARSPCLLLGRHFDRRAKQMHFAWLPCRLRD